MFDKEIYRKNKDEVKELLASLQQCDESALISVEDFPTGTFKDKNGETQALFKMYVDDPKEGEFEILISRKLKEWLIEKEVLLP